MRNIFHEKSYTKRGAEELVPDPFLKNLKLSVSLNQQPRVL